MPHIDEGLLHQYLDEHEGNDRSRLPEELQVALLHVGTCTHCTALLEEARSLRSGAESILAGAEPRIETPPFSQVVERARAQRHERGQLRWIRRGRTLSLAATIVLAVGAGWLIRDRFPESPAATSEARDVGDAIVPTISPATPNATEAGRLNLEPSQRPTELNAQLEERDAVAKQAIAAETVSRGAGARTDQPVTVALRRAEAPPARERAEMEMPADLVASDLDVAGAVAISEYRGVTLDSIAAIFGDRKVDDALKDAVVEERQMRAQVAPTDELDWVTVDRATAERAIGQLALIPGATIETIHMAERFGTTAVMVSQRIENATVSLLEWRASAGNEVRLYQFENAPTGRTAGESGQIVIRTVNGLIIAARSDMPLDSLQNLLATIGN